MVAYILIRILAGNWTGPDHHTSSTPLETLLGDIIIPVGIGAMFLVVAVSATRGWEAVMTEPAARPRGLLLIAAVIVGVLFVWKFFFTQWETFTPGYIAVLALGSLMIGFAEEVAIRGVLLVGLRTRFSEAWVLVITSLVFGLMHGAYTFSGIVDAPAIQQILFAALLGSLLYAFRRLTGSLLWPILIHSIWSFSSFTTLQAPGGPSSFGLLEYVLCELGLVAAVAVIVSNPRRRRSHHRASPVWAIGLSRGRQRWLGNIPAA